jgi:hypothetical protein
MAVDVPASISGEDILSDLLDRIAERLILTNSLRAVDCYRGYSARVTVELQLDDIDTVAISTEVEVGSIDPLRPSERITAGASARAEQVQERTGHQPPMLEKPIDDAGVAALEAVAPKRKRFYVTTGRPRGRPPKG